MKYDELKYGKPEAYRSPKTSGGKQGGSIVSSVSTPIEATSPPGYVKGEPHIKSYMFFVLSGGAKREKDYFKQLLEDRKITRVKLAFRSKDGQGLTPTQLNDLAGKFLSDGNFLDYKNEKHPIKRDDTLFLLQDMDEFERELRCIYSKGINEQILWIVSNPCFEIWLFYHKFNTPCGYLDAGLSIPIDKRSKWLKHELNNLIPGGANPIALFSDIETASENSKNNYKEANGLPAIYSTQMHILADEILCHLGDDFNDMLERKRQEVAKFLKSGLP